MMLTEICTALRYFAEGKHEYNSNVYGIYANIRYKGIVLAGLEFENKDYKENENLSGYSLNKIKV